MSGDVSRCASSTRPRSGWRCESFSSWTPQTRSAISGCLRETGADLDGYWLHLDVDVLDPEYLPAVDSPDPGGLNPDELTALLGALAHDATGAQVTVFDPDLDPDGSHGRLLANILFTGLRDLGAASATRDVPSAHTKRHDL